MNRKGIVSIIEMVITAIVLLTAFNAIFPKNVYHTDWGTAQTLLNSRDVIATTDRLGKLYYYSYNQDAMGSLVRSILGNSTIVWSETNGLVKNRLSVACNCTDEQRSNIASWLQGLVVNNRSVDANVYYTDLESINPSLLPDVLVVWQNKTIISPLARATLKDFISHGNGVVEVADFPASFNFTTDLVQRDVFGVQSCSLAGIANCNYSPTENNDSVNTPQNTTLISYVPYKYLYHVPLAVNGFTNVSSIPVEGGTPPCTSSSAINGNFRFYNISYTYWICSSPVAVYFDTDGNGIADRSVSKGSNFVLNGTNFYMSFVNVNNFGIGLRQGFGQQEYRFRDFLKDGNTRVYPADNDTSKIFLSYGNYSGTTNQTPVVVLNSSGSYRTAWIADFSRNGLAYVGDDQKMLFVSLLLWASNKHAVPNALGSVAFGYSTSYVSTVSQDRYDMFEPYSFSLGTGQPY